MSKAIQGAAELTAAVGFFAAAALIPGAGAIIGSVVLDDVMASIGIAGVASEAGAISDALTQNRGMGITTRQPAGFRQIIYGTQRVPGIIIYQSTTGSHYDQYNYVIVLATHEIAAIENLYLDGRQVHWQGSGPGYTQSPDGTWFGGAAGGGQFNGPNGQHYDFDSLVYCEARYGNQLSGDVIAALNANDPNWASSADGSPYVGGCAFVYLKFEYDSAMFPQAPEIRFTVRGKNSILDPRTGATGYTNNWALIVNDILTDPAWGLGDSTVNQAQLIAAANVCDEQIDLAAGLTAGSATGVTSIPIESQGGAFGGSPSLTITISGNGSGATATPVITSVQRDGETLYSLSSITVVPGSGYTEASVSIESSGWQNPPVLGQPVIGNESSTLTESRYTANWHYDTSTSVGDALHTLMGAAGGRISRPGGEWMIYPAYWPGVTFTADESMLIDAITWVPKRSVSDLVNRVTGTYVAANYPYNVAGNLYDSNGWFDGTIQNNFPFAFQPTNYPQYAADALHGYGEGVDVYLTEDGGVPHPKELSQPCVLSVSQAQRLAKIALLRNRQQGTGSFAMSLSAWQTEPNDVMQFTMSAQGWTSKYLEITSLGFEAKEGQESQGGKTALQLGLQVGVGETDPSVYEWSPFEELTVYDVPAAASGIPYIVSPPSNLSIEDDTSTQAIGQDGTAIPRVFVSWIPPQDTYVNNGGSIEVQYQFGAPAGGNEPTLLQPIRNQDGSYSSAWIDVGKFSGTSTYCYIDGINQTQYQNISVQARSVRSGGAVSEWVLVSNYALSFPRPIVPIGVGGGGTGARFYFTDSGTYLDQLEPAQAGADVTSTHTSADTSAVNGVLSTTVSLATTGQQTNMVPDSDLKFGSTYWTLGTYLTLSAGAGLGADGGNAFVYVGTGSASGTIRNFSSPIAVTPGATYTVSGYIDGTNVTSGTPEWYVVDVSTRSHIYGQAPQAVGVKGRVSVSFVVPAGITSITVSPTTHGCTVASGANLLFSNPQLEIGAVATAYKPNIADAATGYLKAGASQVDFSSTIHLNKTLDNVADGSTYARPRATTLSAGYVVKTGSTGQYNIKGVGDSHTLSLDSEIADGTSYKRVGATHVGTSGALQYTTGVTIDSLMPAQVGADVTSNNTARDTSNVNGVISSSISPIAALMPAESGANVTETRVSLQASNLTNHTLDNLSDGSNYKRVGAAHVGSGGSLQYTNGATIESLQPSEAGADVTSTNTAMAIAGQGSLATANEASLDSQVSDGTTYQRMPTSNMDSNRRALIDFSESGHLDKNLDNVGDGTSYARIAASHVASGGVPAYAGGATMDSLMPAQAGADVTAQAGNVTLQNPNCVVGLGGWILGSGWAGPSLLSSLSVAGPTPALTSAGVFQASSAITSAFENNQITPCAPGSVISATCWGTSVGSGCSNSGFSVSILFWNASGSLLLDAGGSNIATGSGWQQSRIAVTAPSDAAYFNVTAVIYDGVGTFAATGYTASILPNSLDDVPNGSARYAAGEAGADQTSNHLAFATGSFPSAIVQLQQGVPTTILTATLNIASPDDVFALWLWIGSPSYTATDSVTVEVDGAGSYGHGHAPNGMIIGAISGLSAGSHTLSVSYTTSSSVSGNSMEANVCYAMVQQVSSSSGGFNVAPTGGRIVPRPAFN
jgi:hypothetical protein